MTHISQFAVKDFDANENSNELKEYQVEVITFDERANIFPCLQRPKPRAVANVRWATLCLTLTKQVFRKDYSVERKPTILAHSTAKEKPRRYLRGNALGIDRESRRETRLSEPFRSRHQARLTIARQRSRNALNRIWCIIYRPVKMNWSQDTISK